MHPLIDQKKQQVAKHYERDKMITDLASYIITGILIFVLVYAKLSQNYVSFLSGVTSARILAIFLYFVPLYTGYSLVTFPISCIAGYYIEKKYDFSRQNFVAWVKDWIKSFFVSFVIGLIVFEAIYLITFLAPGFWWFWLSVIMIAFSVLLANIFPVVILPLFYKTEPLTDEDLKKQTEEICERAGINLSGIYSINLSSKTSKANAAVAGLGHTKRILIGDTLLGRYTTNEIITVLAHEITHDSERHTWWLVLWQSIIILLTFYIIYRGYPFFFSPFGFAEISDIAAFPVFALLFGIVSFLLNPIGTALSRHYERKADQGALALTENPEVFIRLMAKLGNDNLSLAYPHPLIEWYRYSHPSIGKRIALAERWRK